MHAKNSGIDGWIWAFRERGLDMFDVSIGFSTIEGKTPWVEGLSPICRMPSAKAGPTVATAWCIDGPAVANTAIEKGDLDLIMIDRAHLADPHHPYVAAQTLGDEQAAWTPTPLYPLAFAISGDW